MLSLTNKHILLGITGGIAAYKCAELARLFIKAGAQVRVVMTRAATEFVTPLTMQALTSNRVHIDLLDAEAEAGMGHIELARWADLILIAPATADFLARMTHGRADDLLTTLILATPAPVAVAPAMNQGMWADAATQANLQVLGQRQIHIFGPDSGEQACGDVGAGRMIEPLALSAACAELFATGFLAGKHVVLTGGPTREAIDPVRFLSNHSSGKMAYALAAEAVAAGARVTLISGPVSLPTPKDVTRIDVVSARQMLDATLDNVGEADIFIGVAAVADYRPEDSAIEKIKKHADTMQLTLVKNPDIISTVANLADKPFVVGFAAETEKLIEHGKEKLQKKNLDLLFANNATDTFNSDAVAVTVISADGEQAIKPGSKQTVARLLLQEIAQRLPAAKK
ncbi:MAG: bifunctional phosphopantothenoylcysteine decarboxylase/phosphopantothenate--cysteine ligase CoaBC [Gammaproteobacteria bacterium]